MVGGAISRTRCGSTRASGIVLERYIDKQKEKSPAEDSTSQTHKREERRGEERRDEVEERRITKPKKFLFGLFFFVPPSSRVFSAASKQAVIG